MLRGARDEAYGLGPEIVLSLRPLPARLRLRYEGDVTVKSRPQGEIFLFSLEFAAWRPRPAVTPGARFCSVRRTMARGLEG